MKNFGIDSFPAPIRALLRHPALASLRSAYADFIDRHPILACNYGDFTLYYPKSSVIGNHMAGGAGWNSNLRTVLTQLFEQPSPVIAEVGSNIGASLLQMMLAKPQAKYYCFEPSARFSPFLKKNVKVNGWSNVQVEEVLVSSKIETKTLFNNASTASVVSADYDSHPFFFGQEVTATTLDHYFGDVERLDMIKVDTDGYDYQVLLGARHLIERLRPVLYFELAGYLLKDAGNTLDELMSYVCDLGYKSYVTFNPEGRAVAFDQQPHAVVELAQSGYWDVLTVHSENRAQEQQLMAIREALK